METKEATEFDIKLQKIASNTAGTVLFMPVYSGIIINDIRAEALAKALETNNTIHAIALAQQQIGDVGIKALSKVLKNRSTLICLDFSHNNIGDEGAAALAEVLESNPDLKTIALQNNPIGDAGLIALSGALITNKKLREFRIGSSGITDVGLAALVPALKELPKIDCLYFINSSISVKGCSLLSELLKTVRSLSSLNISGNGIDDLGVAPIIETLTTHETLQYLSIANNLISDASMIALAAALKNNISLETLCLEYNLITDQGAVLLAEALKSNRVLTNLFLGEDLPVELVDLAPKAKDNSYTDVAVVAFNETLNVNFNLLSINFGYRSAIDQSKKLFAKLKEKLVRNYLRQEERDKEIPAMMMFLFGLKDHLVLAKQKEAAEKNKQKLELKTDCTLQILPKEESKLQEDSVLQSSTKEKPLPEKECTLKTLVQNPLFEPKLVAEVLKFVAPLKRESKESKERDEGSKTSASTSTTSTQKPPTDLSKRKIQDLGEVKSLLEQCKTPKDWDSLPAPELAFRRAAAKGQVDIMRKLKELVLDLDINQPGDSGKTAMAYAKEYNQKAAIAYLERAQLPRSEVVQKSYPKRKS